MKEQGKKNVPSMDVDIDLEKVGDKVVGGVVDAAYVHDLKDIVERRADNPFRGVVMNPCDRPHGSGEAKGSIGMAALDRFFGSQLSQFNDQHKPLSSLANKR